MQSQALRTPQLQVTKDLNVQRKLFSLMQAALSVEQSLSSVQTLLRAGLGCITYLRNLLPEENFNESYLTSSSAPSLSSRPPAGPGSFSSDNGAKRNVSSFRIMTVSRGFTDEADTLLNYMENGIFDALQKQYLKSFVFAICLDNQDPNNIVEAYTFNFKYHSIPGTNLKVPVMTLGDDLMKLSLNGNHIADTAPKSRVPTLGEVKKSLRMLARNLIQATTQMEALPKRRFATFKLFYYDHTPEDYNPPHFREGDVEKDRWFFATHDVSEVPERCSIGSLETGWHGVDVKIASVASFLPSTEDNSGAFTGTTQGTSAGPALTPVEQNARSLHQNEIQMRDAESRRIMYDADGLCDEDAEGEEDPDYSRDAPIGLRSEDGSVLPLPPAREAGPSPMELDHAMALNGKLSTPAPADVFQLMAKNPVVLPGEETQKLPGFDSASATPRPQGLARMQSASLPPSEIEEESYSFLGTKGIDTQMLKDQLMDIPLESSGVEDSEMLDMETQMPAPAYPDEDPIQSFGTQNEMNQSQVHPQVEDQGLKCECGVEDGENSDCCYCDGCGRWYHVWCMGFHSTQDKRLPENFVCFDCRVRADQNWELIKTHELYPRMISKFKEVALFRRALKTFEEAKPDTVSVFTKKVGCAADLGGQLFKRLEAEGFIAQETKETDNLGLMEVHKHSKSNKRGKAEKKKKYLQRTKYVFVPAVKKQRKYKDYFNPDITVEGKLLGLDKLEPRKKSRPTTLNHNAAPNQGNSQSNQSRKSGQLALARIQEGTRLLALTTAEKEERIASDLKRKISDEENGRSKKQRIAVAPLVDLGE